MFQIGMMIDYLTADTRPFARAMKRAARLARNFIVVSATMVSVVYATDVSITAANVSPVSGAGITTAIAGVSITAGQLVYVDSATSTVKLADANASILTAKCAGIAVNGAASGQYVTYATTGDINIGGTVTVGGVYVVSANAGGLAPVADLTTGWYTTVFCIGKTASIVTIVNKGPSTLVAVP